MSSLTFILVVAAARKNNFPGAGLDESCSRVEVPHTFLTNWNTRKLYYTLWKPFVRKRAEIQRYKPCKRSEETNMPAAIGAIFWIWNLVPVPLVSCHRTPKQKTHYSDRGQTRKTRKILQRKGCHFYCSKFHTSPVSCWFTNLFETLLKKF